MYKADGIMLNYDAIGFRVYEKLQFHKFRFALFKNGVITKSCFL